MKYVLLMMAPIEGEGCDQANVEEFMAFDAELHEAGVHAGGFALHGPEDGTSVSKPSRGAEPVVTAGPFAESREFVGGTYIIDVADLDEALSWAKRCPGALGGRVEIRAIADF